MDEGGLTARVIELSWADTTIERTAGELGVMIDTEAAVESAEERGRKITQPLRWVGSLFRDRSVDIAYSIDRDTLAAHFGTGTDAAFPLGFGHPAIELIDGEFVEVETAEVPTVDVAQLEALVLAAAQEVGDGPARIAVPIDGRTSVDLGAADVIARATDLTDHDLRVKLLGSARNIYISADTIRGWLVFGGTREEPTIGLDTELVLDSLTDRNWGFETAGDEASFVVDGGGGVRIVGPTGIGCCADDTVDRVLAALSADELVVDLLPTGDSAERGVAWAETLGITELIGEFTTNFKPGESRVTNIARIAELTQGVVIEPDTMFSVNEFVGRRTRENGFRTRRHDRERRVSVVGRWGNQPVRHDPFQRGILRRSRLRAVSEPLDITSAATPTAARPPYRSRCPTSRSSTTRLTACCCGPPRPMIPSRCACSPPNGRSVSRPARPKEGRV